MIVSASKSHGKAVAHGAQAEASFRFVRIASEVTLEFVRRDFQCDSNSIQRAGPVLREWPFAFPFLLSTIRLTAKTKPVSTTQNQQMTGERMSCDFL